MDSLKLRLITSLIRFFTILPDFRLRDGPRCAPVPLAFVTREAPGGQPMSVSHYWPSQLASQGTGHCGGGGIGPGLINWKCDGALYIAGAGVTSSVMHT